MVTIYPYTPLTFILDDGDTATVNILKDSISVYRGKYALYAYFYKHQYGRLYDITIVIDNGAGITLKPSYVDIDLSKKIIAAARLFDVQVLDHLIMTDESFLSMAEEGLL